MQLYFGPGETGIDQLPGQERQIIRRQQQGNRGELGTLRFVHRQGKGRFMGRQA